MHNFASFSLLNYPSVLLVLGWLLLMHSLRQFGYGIAFISFMGTALHEICHLVVGFLLNAKPVSFSLWPKREGRHWVLGSVGFKNINIWNAAFVAFAPFAMLPLGWFAFQLWMCPAFSTEAYLSWIISGYVVACCAYACMPSIIDIRVGALSAAMYCAIVFVVWSTIFK
jgi:hypothetical protein